MLPATRVVFPEEELNGCYNFDIVGNRRTAPGVCGHGYVPVSHSGIRRFENWTNNSESSNQNKYEYSLLFQIAIRHTARFFVRFILFLFCLLLFNLDKTKATYVLFTFHLTSY